ncbi:MAG: ubiquinone/menaquinone biosynthesis methyltransferase [Phenylobacterium sp.]|uniref:ubiquinone/menaquinone biosynthesis methyltransferase n=1 Tax=Phenylobacterium sp. TaxID=1871053 RepID=UPI00391DE32C
MTASENAAAFRPGEDDVFARIARRYDLLCDLFSLGAHRYWKARMARRIAQAGGASVLDLASGTGDIPRRLLRRPEFAGRSLWVTDLSPAMLEVAREKLAQAPGVRCRTADAERLTGISANSFDIVSISLAMKICDRKAVLREALRVLRPGGLFFCLEAGRVRSPALRALYLEYMTWCVPLMAQLAAGGDRGAYDYLLKGIRTFPDADAFAGEIEAAGFTDVGYEPMTFGVVSLHYARKPRRG